MLMTINSRAKARPADPTNLTGFLPPLPAKPWKLQHLCLLRLRLYRLHRY